MTTTYDFGDAVRLTAVFRDLTGALADPTTVTFRVRKPDGVETAYLYLTDAEVVRASIGSFRIDLTADQYGPWAYRWESTGTAQAAEEGDFIVQASAFAPLALVLETGAGLATANSYASIAEADLYHLAHTAASTWSAATLAQKTAALVMATRLLDAYVPWGGTRVRADQALGWPRYSVYDRDNWAVAGNIVPVPLKNATAELARLLLAGDRTADPQTLGFKRIKAGSLELEVDPADRLSVIPGIVWWLLGPLALATAGRTGTVKLIRA